MASLTNPTPTQRTTPAALEDGEATGLTHRIRLTAWVVTLTVRSAADLVTTRGARHA